MLVRVLRRITPGLRSAIPARPAHSRWPMTMTCMAASIFGPAPRTPKRVLHSARRIASSLAGAPLPNCCKRPITRIVHIDSAHVRRASLSRVDEACAPAARPFHQSSIAAQPLIMGLKALLIDGHCICSSDKADSVRHQPGTGLVVTHWLPHSLLQSFTNHAHFPP